MVALPRSSVSRRLLLWFAATTIVPTLAVISLGWIMVRQDRDLERSTLREQVAEAGVAALTRTLAEFDEVLSNANRDHPTLGAVSDRAAFISLSPQGLVARAGVGLPFYPASPVDGGATAAEALARSDRLEFASLDLTAARRALLPLLGSAEPAVRAAALVRVARLERKSGATERALDAFTHLAQENATLVEGVPAGLSGHIGRALIFRDQGAVADLRREALELAAALSSGQWPLTEEQYRYEASQVAGWLGDEQAVSAGFDQHLLAIAAQAVWRDWQGGRDGRNGQSHRTEWVANRSVLAVVRQDSAHLSILVVTPELVRTSWFANMTLHTGEVDLALSDPDGHPAVGQPDEGSGQQSVRTSATTKLPWTVHAISRGAAGPWDWSSRSRFVMAGVLVMVLVVATSGSMITRAVARETEVARLQSDFVSAVSHEFRTPVTAIRQLSELLVRQRVATDDQRQTFYETLLRESERLQRLIEGLLDFGRFESGRVEYSFSRVDLPALVSEVAAEVERDPARSGSRISVGTSSSLPSVRGDRESLSHVFRNLLDNAVKYSLERQDVDVTFAADQRCVTVRVRDHGLGIPEAEQQAIFNKFVRGAAAAHLRIKGTGVGLAMARLIVEAHGGTIGVESAPGKGSTFIVSLPASAAAGA
jgi:signal transduction histidine kinase